MFSSLDFFANCCSPTGTGGKMVMAEPPGKSAQRVRPQHTLSGTNFSRHSSSVVDPSGNHSIYSSPAPSVHERNRRASDLRLSSAIVPEQRQAPFITNNKSSCSANLQATSEDLWQAEDDPEDLNCLNETSAATALHKACRRGNLKVVQYLLDVLHFKNLDSVDDNGDTALHICAHNGNYRACEILLEVTRFVSFFHLGRQSRCNASKLEEKCPVIPAPSN